MSGSETSDPFPPSSSPQIWSNEPALEVRLSIKIAFGAGSTRHTVHLPSPQVHSTNQSCVYFYFYFYLIYSDNYGNLSPSRKIVILSFLGNGVRARIFLSFSGSDLGSVICTWATILYRIDATVAKLDSNHQAHQTKSLQRPEEDKNCGQNSSV